MKVDSLQFSVLAIAIKTDNVIHARIKKNPRVLQVCNKIHEEVVFYSVRTLTPLFSIE